MPVVEDSTVRASIWDLGQIGVRYLKELREKIGNAITAARPTDGPFASEYDLERRVPSIQNGTHIVGEAGAFNWSGKKHDRRTALWRAERAGQANVHKDVMAQVEEHGYRTYGSLRKPWKNL